MKVLHVAYSLSESSAATRISSSMLNEHEIFFFLGRISDFLYVRNRQLFPYVSNFMGVFFHCVNIVLNKLLNTRAEEIFSTGLFWRIQYLFLKYVIKKYDIDILHIHWGGYSFIPVQALKNLPVKIIVTAHDYNYFTGGCHIPMSCSQIKRDCESCPLVTKNHWLIKYLKKNREAVLEFLKDKLIVVAPSKYTEKYIKGIYPFLQVVVVPNPLDAFYLQYSSLNRLEFYQEKSEGRKYKYQILVVGVAASTQDNKGYDLLCQVVDRLLRSRDDIGIVQVSGTKVVSESGKIKYIDKLNSGELASLYAASDLTVVPSKFETFSQVSLESLSQCTPVIAFDKSGPADIILDHITGRLVESFDNDGFFKAVEQFVDYKSRNPAILKEYVDRLRLNFSPESVSNQYQVAYEI